ncbi:hypothetical protein HELRODRAFT_187853 [Helobdella robusta]|uniref:SAP domain-containing protein n=1 Tax=Helobdella robusta TaxID=6412 RepID=T1FPF4_HELRO|nr:hypothetical protein HELRODRAFT_187853 [Helobdella robusta]ESO12390.1 hypothetical protein HELRODRAFT_187853 [Helobdella robusta]
MSERDYSKLTVNVLKEELKKRGLDQAGKKADLVSRLESDDLNNSMLSERIYLNEDTTEEADEAAGQTSAEGTNEDPKEDCIETTTEVMNEDKDSTDDSCTMDQPIKNENVSLTQEYSGDLDSSTQHPEESHVDDNSSFSEGMKEISESKEHAFLSQSDFESKEQTLPKQQSDGDAETKCEDMGEDMTKIPEEPQSNNETCASNQKETVEEMETKESADPAAAEEDKKDSKPNAENDVRIANEYCIEMKRDKDEFQLKWKGKKFSVPFIGEIVLDLAREISSRSFQVKQIELKDLKSSCFDDVINESLKFLVDFQSNILDSSKVGFAKFVFKSVEECEKHKNALKGYNENIIIESVKFEGRSFIILKILQVFYLDTL